MRKVRPECTCCSCRKTFTTYQDFLSTVTPNVSDLSLQVKALWANTAAILTLAVTNNDQGVYHTSVPKYDE